MIQQFKNVVLEKHADVNTPLMKAAASLVKNSQSKAILFSSKVKQFMLFGSRNAMKALVGIVISASLTPVAHGDEGASYQELCGCTLPPHMGSYSVPVTIRDFKDSHPDFESTIGTDRGIVAFELGFDGKPVYASSTDTLTTTGEENFDQWYRDVDGVNTSITKQLELVQIGTDIETGVAIWQYSSNSFFPIDQEGFGNQGRSHNYHFTLETHQEFTYYGGEVFEFSGDDDLWLFINGRLAIDIGGVHSAQSKVLNLDEKAGELGLVKGNTYRFDLFFAERHTTQSNFKFTTTIDLGCL